MSSFTNAWAMNCPPYWAGLAYFSYIDFCKITKKAYVKTSIGFFEKNIVN